MLAFLGLHCQTLFAGQNPSALRIGVVDFRPPALSESFKADLDHAIMLRLKGLKQPHILVFENAPLPRQTFAEAISKVLLEKPDVFYATTTVIAREVRKLAPSLPIVFSGIADPRKNNLVTRLDKPGNNMTGFVSYADTENKRLEILKQALPLAKTVLLVTDDDRFSDGELEQRARFAESMGLTLEIYRIRNVQDVLALKTVLQQHKHDAVDLPAGAFLRQHESFIISQLKANHTPASVGGEYFVEKGILLSYSVRDWNYAEKAAEYIARIAAGEDAGNIPVQLASEFTLAINLNTAAELNIKLRTSLLKRATRIFR